MCLLYYQLRDTEIHKKCCKPAPYYPSSTQHALVCFGSVLGGWTTVKAPFPFSQLMSTAPPSAQSRADVSRDLGPSLCSIRRRAWQLYRMDCMILQGLRFLGGIIELYNADS